MALTIALMHPEVHVEAITVVRGNVGLEQTVRNARLVVETCGADVPVYAGAQGPLARAPEERPAWISGEDGFGNTGLQPRRGEADPGFAPGRIAEIVFGNPGEVTIVALAPLTNLALALAREPGIAAATRELVVMGGTAHAIGNLTPVAEFNIHSDPEAARAVFRAGFRLTMVGIELSRGAARLTKEDVTGIAALGTPASDLVSRLLRHSLSIAARRSTPPGEHGAACPDAVAMAVALDRAVLTDAVDAFVDIETRGELTTGMTVIDRLSTLGRPPNVHVGLDVDAARFKSFLHAACAR